MGIHFLHPSEFKKRSTEKTLSGLFLLLLFSLLTISTVHAQISFGTGLSGWAYLGGSNDNSFHPGINLRTTYDYRQFAFDVDFSYYMPVQNSVPGKAISITVPMDPLAPKINIYNNVKGSSWQAGLNFQYFFLGMPMRGSGLYGIIGAGLMYYTQEYALSDFDDSKYQPIGMNDGFRKSISQYTVRVGLGGSYPVRKSSLFLESHFSFPTNKDKDIDLAITSSHFLTIEGGIRIPIVSRKTRFERMALGRTGKAIKKSKARIRR